MDRTRHIKLNLRPAGYTLLEILYALAIIGILSSLAVLNYSGYKSRAHDAVAQEDLRQAYSSATLYFMNNPKGTLTLSELGNYGFRGSPNVDVKIIHGRLADLLLTARYNAPAARIYMGLGSQPSMTEVPGPSGQEIAPESSNAASPERAPERSSASLRSALLEECNRETQRALMEAFATGRAYLADNPEGWVTKEILVDYGFSPNENVNLTVVNGGSPALSMSAIFNFSEATNFTIDASGSISSAR